MKTWQIFLSTILFSISSLSIASDNIARAVFTTGVDQREPVDQIGQLSNDNEKVYFYTELRGLSGKAVTHRWEHGGETKAEVTFNVGGDRWRVWSSKNLQPQWLGEWIVTVVDDAGTILAEESMAYAPAAETASEMPASEPAANEPTTNEPMTNEPAEQSTEPQAAVSVN